MTKWDRGIWTDIHNKVYKLSEMSEDYINNVINYLKRNAEELNAEYAVLRDISGDTDGTVAPTITGCISSDRVEKKIAEFQKELERRQKERYYEVYLMTPLHEDGCIKNGLFIIADENIAKAFCEEHLEYCYEMKEIKTNNSGAGKS